MPKPEPAFPSNPMWGRTGMSLRDWFATHAPEPLALWRAKYHPDYEVDMLVAWNYAYADAMLKEREVE